jgi:shikimate kinase
MHVSSRESDTLFYFYRFTPGMGNYNFLDTDEIIVKATGMTIPEIFAAEGEEGFRKVEGQVLDSVHPYVRCVISTGGGIVLRRENWSKLHTGLVVWLDCAPEVIVKRIEGTDRPLLQTGDPLQKLKELLEQRKDKYMQSDVRVVVTEDMDENEVADTVFRQLHDFIDENPPAWKLAKAKAQAEGLDWVQ